MLDKFLTFYEKLLHVLAEITVHTLEIIGISIIIFGSAKVLIRTIRQIKRKEETPQNVVIALGRSLALALEFKMGAEIVNTVIIRDLKELAVLGIIIVLRAILAVLIHWEIKTEQREQNEHLAADKDRHADSGDKNKL